MAKSTTQAVKTRCSGRGLAFYLTCFIVVTPVLLCLAVRNHECILEAVFRRPDIKTVFPFSDAVWAAPGAEPTKADDAVVPWTLQVLKTVFPFGSEEEATQPTKPDDDAILPWKLQVSSKDLEDLQNRLRRTRYGTAMPGQNFAYGFPADQLKNIVDYWLNKYDWKKQEALINQYDHFKTNIEGLNIHFVRVQPAKSTDSKRNIRVTPIILLHGWPGSFFELYKLIPLLTTPQQIAGNDYAAFEVIIPSLPGFGFSDAPQQPGLKPADIARIFHKLMTRLNFAAYFVHGSDWGSTIGRYLAVMYPEHVLGVELTLYGRVIPTSYSVLHYILHLTMPRFLFEVSEPHKLLLGNFFNLMRETGYLHIQSTKPDTVGAGLLDSPAGLAGYILEKFSTWTNADNMNKADGGLTEYFNLDDLLTNVMVYWVSGSIITSQRLYKETWSTGGLSDGFPVLVPSVLSDFRHEFAGNNAPDEFVRPYFKDLITISKHNSGGHFPAMERPADLAEDIWALAKNVLSRE
ncbi:Epoxide hydrolase 1 [Hypsibius exemplaris]|uniref:microsomal epoxide hydrolase n=1 Tax=Hypsibius exemplaris TaxID=2072580 RepID=A0A1W0X172_HYPEX|nr:Epoxide hydrolase 1 [Hypsibius exemplaris]